MKTPKDIEADARRNKGAALKALRRHLGLTQEQVAAALGMTVQGYQNYEGGRRALPDAKINHILTGMNSDREEFDAHLKTVTAKPIPERPRLPATVNIPNYSVLSVGIADAGASPFPVPEQSGARELVDLSAYFAPTVRFVRISGMGNDPYVQQGGFATFDIAKPPRPGQGCIIELRAGTYRLARFGGYTSSEVVATEIASGAEIRIPLADVAGVYAVGLRGE